MDFIKLDEIARKSMLNRISHTDREMGFIYDHGARVSKGVIELRKRVTDDASHDDILTCAGMFHDVGKRIADHAASGAAITRYLLADELDARELDEVAWLVEMHNKRGDARSDIWAKLMQDADLLDHYGSINLWMSFFYYAHNQGRVIDCLKFYDTEYRDEHEHMRAILNFDISRRIFEEKNEFVMNFVNRMRVEGAGGYISCD